MQDQTVVLSTLHALFSAYTFHIYRHSLTIFACLVCIIVLFRLQPRSSPPLGEEYFLFPAPLHNEGVELLGFIDQFPIGGGAVNHGMFSASSFQSYRVAYGTLPAHGTLKYISTSMSGERYRGDRYVGIVIPPSLCMNELYTKELWAIAAAHNIRLGRSGRLVKEVKHVIATHSCNETCRDAVTHFRVVDNGGVPTRSLREKFPPKPLTKQEKFEIVREWCDEMTRNQIIEHPCAVCARITPKKELSTIHEADYDLTVLCRPGSGVTRKERRRFTDPICEYNGPILYNQGITRKDGEDYLNVCKACKSSLSRGQMSRHALANGLWIGDVPAELKGLSFVEKLIIARYRHNICVVRVDKGQRKMCANAVVFPQPVEKFYSILPPPKEELDQCLAILFTGSVVPTKLDYKRTPLLVRHNIVMAALTWLKLNHKDYDDVVISEENMQTYPEDAPPVAVLHRPQEGKLGGEAMAVYEDDDERGVENGQCPFAVHGISGTELADMSKEAKVAVALDFFTSGGSAIAYGHSSQPASMYNNPSMYPGMFPWLFPYGHGGLGNSLISTRMERPRQVRQLLMYGDRRFQIDEYFCFIAFNQQQIIDSNRSGYLLSDRKTAPAIADKIVNVNMTALQRIVERGARGEYLHPEEADERSVFELIQIIDYVSNRVQGSSSTRKLLRNEIFSLIIAKGTPVWFITFVPTDFKSPLCLYYCGMKINLLDSLKDWPDYQKRMRAIAKNPVACARFFHKRLHLPCLNRISTASPPAATAWNCMYQHYEPWVSAAYRVFPRLTACFLVLPRDFRGFPSRIACSPL